MITKHPVTRKRQRGSMLVESAICLLGFFFLMLGTLETTMAVNAYGSVNALAQDGAYHASLNGYDTSTPATADSIQTYVRARPGAMLLNTNNLSVTTTWSPDNTHGSVVTVTVTYTSGTLIGIMLPRQMTYSASSKYIIAS